MSSRTWKTSISSCKLTPEWMDGLGLYCVSTDKIVWHVINGIFYITNCLKTYTDTWRRKTGNRPFPSSSEPLYQDEVKCSVFDAEMTFHSHANKTHFHNRGWVLGLILKVRVLGTRKWPIIKYQAPKIGQALPLFLCACPVIGPSFTLLSSLVPG